MSQEPYTGKKHAKQEQGRFDEAGRAPADRICYAFAMVAAWAGVEYWRARETANILLNLGSDEIGMERAQRAFRGLHSDTRSCPEEAVQASADGACAAFDELVDAFSDVSQRLDVEAVATVFKQVCQGVLVKRDAHNTIRELL